MHKKKCSGCQKERDIWKNHEGGRYCKPCWLRRQAENTKSVKSKPRSLPPNRSRKRQRQDTEYSKVRRSFLSRNPVCKARVPGVCTTRSTDVHHKQGRTGTLLLDEEHFLSTCRSCHNWIEAHPEEAKDLGFSTTRND